MKTGTDLHPEGRQAGSDKCLARSVVDALSDDPALEAVSIDRGRRTISFATLGKADVSQLTARLTDTVRHSSEVEPEEGCLLLAGQGDCLTCPQPLSDLERHRITIRHEAGTITIARVTCPTAPKFWRWRDLPWPRMVQRDLPFLQDAHEIDEWKPQLAAAGLCGVFGLVAHFTPITSWSIVAYLLAYLVGAWFTAQEVWERLQKRTIDVHFLMLAVAAGSASIGAWAEGATLLFLFSLSSALEHFALGRTQRELRSLFREAPRFATVLDDDGREREVSVERLRPGHCLLVKPGAQFPVDAEIVKGRTASDESNLTGEAAPVDKVTGDAVFAGTLNLWGAVEAVVLRPAAESSLRKIIRLIQEAQQQKAPVQRFTDRFSACYTYLVLGLSAVMFFVWWLGFGEAPFVSRNLAGSAFYHTMTLLVVASPCALVLSIPSAVLAAIAWGARHGILFRGGAAVEKLAAVNTVALDKTGTLTTGELRVEKIESFPPGREDDVARLAYSLERLSDHPFARAITRHGKQHQLQPIELSHFESLTGLGLRANHNREEALLGKRDWLAQGRHGDAIGRTAASQDGVSEIWVTRGDLLGRILLRDDLRPQARRVLDELDAARVQTLVLTGDRQAAADHLRNHLKIGNVRAGLKPEEKLSVIRLLTNQGRFVAMVGDGVNDAPSLAAAHIGVAMGARGADAALEQADVVLMHDRLENFLAAFRLSQRAVRIIRQNLVISLGTVLVLVTFALLGKIPLTLGVLGHEGSTVLVVMNSLRLLFGKSPGQQPG